MILIPVDLLTRSIEPTPQEKNVCLEFYMIDLNYLNDLDFYFFRNCNT